MKTSRFALLAGLALAAATLATPTQANAAPTGGDYTFVSMPDFLNNDLADASGSPYWHEGDPNSINDSYATAINTVLDDVASESKDVLVAGDLVDGHWGRDTANTGIFGPVTTTDQKVAQVKLAAGTYFGAYRKQFADHGLNLYAAVGDHDIGDNPWRTSPRSWDTQEDAAWYKFKHDYMQVWRREWARQFTDSGTRFSDHPVGTAYDGSAYATYLTPDVLLVTVNVFQRTKTDVITTVSGGQLTWLQQTLAKAKAANVPWIIVQGHVPVLGPVRYRHSSHMGMVNGASNPFWQTLKQYGVDLYLCGEVHDNTVIVPTSGPVQISHGGLINYGQSTYLTGHVHDGVMDLTIKGWNTTVTPDSGLWESDMARVARNNVTFQPGAHEIGSMRITASHKVLSRTGVMKPYVP